VRLQTYSNERPIAKAAGLDDADAAIAYAVEGWLLGEGDPPHSICLTDDGRDLSGTSKRARRNVG
jgi:hypothetical protein